MSDIYEMKLPVIVAGAANRTFDMDSVRSAARNNEFIQLIKLYRGVSGEGLKDSKEKIESFDGGHAQSRVFDIDGLVEAFKEHLVVEEPYTKEQFLNLIENSIDNMEALQFTDMLDAIEVLCSNIRKRGGLEVIAKEANNFLRNV
tara:strand:+ start:668 stop:1102 length:435 start_codon:yes stop_codon:yes gene_type:complete